MAVSGSDQMLVEQVQQGNKQAFDMLVLKYQNRIVQLVMRYVHNHSDALDVTQDAFIKAYKALPGFRGDSAFYTWLYRIAINTAKNHLLARKRRPPAGDIDVNDAEFYEGASALYDISTPENIMLEDEVAEVIGKAIEGLSEELRTAISLREFEGLSYEEIAETMDCPVGTVRSRIFRARNEIDNKLQALAG
ncbi:MAG: RNA polymerase sigma factor RpoE [Gammaproteobacteria bacterium]|nr:RNA polymerase sigma factor RpoE [Gammaproteobacteria bacterium]